jgi:pimeloyl-ACP methyl ester carboxylesterase
VAERHTLYLVPGHMCTKALWAQQIGALGDVADIRVPDTVSHGSMNAMATALLDDAPDRFAVAGLSMGGGVVFELARIAKGRLSGVALLDTTARPEMPEQSSRRGPVAELARAEDYVAIADLLSGGMFHPENVGREDFRRIMIEMVTETGRDGILRQQQALIDRPDYRGGLSHIDCPALVIVGRDDAPTPPSLAEEIADGIPGAELVVIERAGHMTPMEAPSETTAALRRWLDSLSD